MTNPTINAADLEHMHDLAQEILDTAAITHWAADMSDSTERPFGRQALRIKKLAEQLLELIPDESTPAG